MSRVGILRMARTPNTTEYVLGVVRPLGEPKVGDSQILEALFDGLSDLPEGRDNVTSSYGPSYHDQFGTDLSVPLFRVAFRDHILIQAEEIAGSTLDLSTESDDCP